MTRPVTTPACVCAGHAPHPGTIPDSHLRNAGKNTGCNTHGNLLSSAAHITLRVYAQCISGQQPEAKAPHRGSHAASGRHTADQTYCPKARDRMTCEAERRQHRDSLRCDKTCRRHADPSLRWAAGGVTRQMTPDVEA